MNTINMNTIKNLQVKNNFERTMENIARIRQAAVRINENAEIIAEMMNKIEAQKA